MILKIWSPEQQHQNLLGTCEKYYKFPAPKLTLMSQNLWGLGLSNLSFNSSSRLLRDRLMLRTVDPGRKSLPSGGRSRQSEMEARWWGQVEWQIMRIQGSEKPVCRTDGPGWDQHSTQHSLVHQSVVWCLDKDRMRGLCELFWTRCLRQLTRLKIAVSPPEGRESWLCLVEEPCCTLKVNLR